MIYDNCRRLIEGYTNIDGSKADKSLPVNETDWTPSQTAESYSVNYLDKTADVPEVVRKYAGAGKIEIYKAYTDAIPDEDINEYAHAVKNYDTAYTYDENGNRITEVPAGIYYAAVTEPVKTEYFSLDGMPVASPSKGINIRRVTDSDGHVSTSKVIMK